MTDLAAIRAALAARLGTLDVQASPYMLSSPTPPSAHLYPVAIDYDQAMNRGLDQWDFIVEVFLGAVTDIGAQEKLDTFLAPAGATSVKQALETDRSLGGLVAHTHVLRATGPLVVTGQGGYQVISAQWTVRLRAAGT